MMGGGAVPPPAFDWLPREPPLTPVALLARADAARRLVDRLLAGSDAELARLAGAASPQVVVIAAEAAVDLPWVDGAVWLGIDPAAPALRLPTLRAPTVPPGLIEIALLRRLAPPVVVVPGLVVSLANLRPLARPVLERWRESAESAKSAESA